MVESIKLDTTRARAKQDKPADTATLDPSKPTSPISSDEFTPDGKYVSLSSQLESYLNKTKSELPEKLRELLPDNWDCLDLDLRERCVWLYDYQHDPAKEEIRARAEQAWQKFGYFRAMAARDFGSVSNWDHWASLKHLSPREVACLMFELETKNYDHVKSSNKLWVSRLADVIDEIERLATRDTEGEKLSPSEWIAWAQSKGYAVPQKFIKAIVEVVRKEQAEERRVREEMVRNEQNKYYEEYGANPSARTYPKWQIRMKEIAEEMKSKNRLDRYPTKEAAAKILAIELVTKDLVAPDNISSKESQEKIEKMRANVLRRTQKEWGN